MSRSLDEWVSRKFEELSSASLQPIDVAVLDSGIDATHQDLAGRIVHGYEINVENGKTSVLRHETPVNADLFGHGTGVASVIARLAPNARIVDVRVLGPGNYGTAAALVAGLSLAVEQKFRVINMSLAAKADYALQLWPLCERAYRQNQIVVASRRNVPLHGDGFPAEFSSCISVDRERFSMPYQLRFRSDSNIEYAANGDDVVVAAPGGKFTLATGTSFAAPAVSAMCALLLGAYPDLRTFELKTILKRLSD
jgi:subtilisin family serine protease